MAVLDSAIKVILSCEKNKNTIILAQGYINE